MQVMDQMVHIFGTMILNMALNFNSYKFLHRLNDIVTVF